MDDLSSADSFFVFGWEDDVGNDGNTSFDFRGPCVFGFESPLAEFARAGAAGEMGIGLSISAVV